MRKNRVIWFSFAVVSIYPNFSPSIAGESQSSTPPKSITFEKDLLPYCQELRYANRYCRRKQNHWECFDHAVVKSLNSEYPIDFRPTCTKWDIESVQSFCEVWTDDGRNWYDDVKNTVHGKSSAIDAILKLWKRDGPVTLEGWLHIGTHVLLFAGKIQIDCVHLSSRYPPTPNPSPRGGGECLVAVTLFWRSRITWKSA